MPQIILWFLFPEVRLGNPTVTIAQGTIEGKDIRYDWGTLDRFTAIPYAAPPTGDLRFGCHMYSPELYSA